LVGPAAPVLWGAMSPVVAVRVVAVLVLLAPAIVAAPVAAQERPSLIGEEALARIDYPWRELGWTVEFRPGRPGFLGLARGPVRRIEIFVRPDHDVSEVAHTLAHELGHAVDLTYGSTYRRREYRRMRGLSTSSKWFGCDECSDYATPAGDFAEVFEYWLLGGGDYRSRLAGPPDVATLAEMELLFRKPFPPSASIFWRQRWHPTT
jgi:hypothetical protein